MPPPSLVFSSKSVTWSNCRNQGSKREPQGEEAPTPRWHRQKTRVIKLGMGKWGGAADWEGEKEVNTKGQQGCGAWRGQITLKLFEKKPQGVILFFIYLKLHICLNEVMPLGLTMPPLESHRVANKNPSTRHGEPSSKLLVMGVQGTPQVM